MEPQDYKMADELWISYGIEVERKIVKNRQNQQDCQNWLIGQNRQNRQNWLNQQGC